MPAGVTGAMTLIQEFNELWTKNYFKHDYSLAGLSLDCDPLAFPGRRKPVYFGIERRAGFRYDENIFFSPAPLRTKDHFALLERLEALARD
jgi:hypothetical protein